MRMGACKPPVRPTFWNPSPTFHSGTPSPFKASSPLDRAADVIGALAARSETATAVLILVCVDRQETECKWDRPRMATRTRWDSNPGPPGPGGHCVAGTGRADSRPGAVGRSGRSAGLNYVPVTLWPVATEGRYRRSQSLGTCRPRQSSLSGLHGGSGGAAAGSQSAGTTCGLFPSAAV